MLISLEVLKTELLAEEEGVASAAYSLFDNSEDSFFLR